MNRNRRAVASALTATAALFVLSSCGSDGGNSVSGNLDDTKFRAAKFRSAERTVNVTSTRCSNVKVKHTSGSGKAARTWYADERKCKDVKIGTRKEHYRKTVAAAKWCVELDNINGKKSDDDQWYAVSQATYLKWAGRNEGTKVKNMDYTRSGC